MPVSEETRRHVALVDDRPQAALFFAGDRESVEFHAVDFVYNETIMRRSG